MGLLSHGRLDGKSQNDENEHDRADQKHAANFHGQDLLENYVWKDYVVSEE
jgi:hypothetical protein